MLLAPSVLAGDLADLKGVAEICVRGGADMLHVDVMDGHFVPNLTFGIPVIRDLARVSKLPLDVHLMVSNPDALLDEYIEAGASWLSVHWEATVHPDRTVGRIRELGAKAGVALNPATPVSLLQDLLPRLDFVLLMSVNPGFAGQPFLPYVVDKARRLRALLDDRGLDVDIQMDGGIDATNVRTVVEAGVDACVAGSAVFGADDPVAAIQALKLQGEIE